MAGKSRKNNNSSSKGPRMLDAAAQAMIELGQSMEDLKASWEHLQRARRKGRPATQAATRAGKRAVRTTRKATRAAVKNTRRALSR